MSNYGRIRRAVAGQGAVAGKIICANRRFGTGYAAALLSRGKKSSGQNVAVHRLVATAFIGPPPTDKHVVNHKDGNRLNNFVGNLEWVTPSENQQHAFRIGLNKPRDLRGERHYNAKLTFAQVCEIRRMAGLETTKRLASRFGVSRSAIELVLSRKRWNYSTTREAVPA